MSGGRSPWFLLQFDDKGLETANGAVLEGFCFDPVKTDWQNDALFGGKCPVVMLAIDTEIEKEAHAEGVSYEKDKESTALKAGAAAADEAADAL